MELAECIERSSREAGSAGSVLIVEDDATAAALLARALRRQRYTVQTAASIQQALQISARWSPQAAIVDLKLGSESGLKLIPALVQSHPAIRILVLTGYASVATAVQAIKLGATDYLPKPAELAEILKILAGEQVEAPLDSRLERPSPRRLEWEYIQKVLAEHDGNISETARALGMLRRTLQRKLTKRPSRG